MTRPNSAVTVRIVALSLVLGVLLGLYWWLPHFSLLSLLAPTAESLVLVGVIWSTSRAPKPRRSILVLLSVLGATLVVFGMGEAFQQAIFRKGFVPWTDLAFLPALLNMVLGTELFSRTIFVILPVALLVGLVSTIVYALVRALETGFRRGGTSEALVAVSLLAVLAASHAIVRVQAHRGWGEDPPLAVRAFAQLSPPEQLHPSASDRSAALTVDPAGDQSTGSGVDAAPGTSYAFDHLRDRDIHLFIVESYGHTVMSNPDHRRLMDPVYDDLSERLRRSGYSGYTGFLVSPAFGGRSWLADATMLTGVFIDTQHAYDSLIGSGMRNLTHILGEAGYHRLLAAPGTYEAGDEWRAFYEFDQYLFRYDFGYRGPFVSFGAMPDQFLIARANEVAAVGEIAAVGDDPLFMNYILVSSHVPFDRVPPYVEEWNDLGDGSIFNELPLRTFENNWLTGGEYAEGYVASIEYTLTSIIEYLVRLDDEALVIIVGDHQPRIPISEPDASFSVPIHVVSRDPELVGPFRHYGFTRGFTPDARLAAAADEHPRMDALLDMLLDVARGVTRMYDYLQP